MKRAVVSAVLFMALVLQCIGLASCSLSMGPYTVGFNTNGGSPTPESVVVNRGELLERPEDPERAGYEFGGWYYDGKAWDFESDTVKSNMTLTAYWRHYGNGGNYNLIEKDWKGADFTVLTADDSARDEVFKIVDLTFGEGDSLNDFVSQAVYERNETIKRVYNANVVRKAVNGDSYTEAMVNTLAGDDECDAYMLSVADSLGFALTGKALDIYNHVSYINIDEEWWDTEAIRSIAICGRVYMVLGDINVVDDYATYCVYYNKYLAERSGMPNFYEEVKQGNWTVDNMKRWATAYAADANGDEERYGLIYGDGIASALIHANGFAPFKLHKNGSLTSALHENELKNAIGVIRDGFMLDCAANDVWALNVDRNQLTEEQVRGLFAEDKALFYFSYCGNNERLARETKYDFGMLPLPKLNGAQTEYGSAISYADATCYTVPFDVYDVDFTGFVLEALCYYSSHEYRERLDYIDTNGSGGFFQKLDYGFMPLSYRDENSLKNILYMKLMAMRGACDYDREAMLDIIFNNRTFDISFMGDVGGINALLVQSASSSAPEHANLLAEHAMEIERIVDRYQTALLKQKPLSEVGG